MAALDLAEVEAHMRYFDLEGNEIQEEHFLALYQNKSMRLLRQTRIPDGFISTVWLGIDHNWIPSGRPLIFETMVFGGPMDHYSRRYSTITEALAGHDELVTVESMERQFA
jgi:hypothetical protein